MFKNLIYDPAEGRLKVNKVFMEFQSQRLTFAAGKETPLNLP